LVRWATGLIVGRFCPPHLGHQYLISRAASQVDHLVVFVNTRRTEPIPGVLRAQWLRELHPEVEVVQVNHELETNFDDSELWERWMHLFLVHWPLDDGPDVLFSSEGYGADLARRFGAEHVVVDAERSVVPVSATMIRADPLAHLDKLAPNVAAWVERWGKTRSG
jgi:HTH-type transcriptional regulator, transcriptional repressor of NAD biosynthesis genes